MNVPLLWHHATSGVPAWGYHGSGPADTALRILAAFLPVGVPAPEGAPTVPLWDGQFVSRQAWALHQAFKADVLAGLDPDREHVLLAQDVQVWILRRT